MFPISGYPFGPGGQDGLSLCRHLQISARDAAAAKSVAAKRVVSLPIMGDEREMRDRVPDRRVPLLFLYIITGPGLWRARVHFDIGRWTPKEVKQ